MTDQNQPPLEWERFVLANGWRAHGYELAAVLGQSVDEIERVRRMHACTRLKRHKEFGELFGLWHGRPPREQEWPVPHKLGQSGYEWQLPEIELLASLVGRMGPSEIAAVLTARLKKRTGDASAERSKNSVICRMQHIGLQTNDVIGGITVAQAAREIGTSALLYHAIKRKELRARRVGRYFVIPHDVWKEWKSKRTLPPKGYVLLRQLNRQLSIRSDKLSEFARMGYVPTAVRCNVYGAPGPSTQFGTWWIERRTAEKLIKDRRAGRPMPWHGKPNADNLKATFKLWCKRQHPASCETCRSIWGSAGAPKSYEDYALRYPPLAHGAKRHLTRRWTAGLTMAQVARSTNCSINKVRVAIRNGTLAAVTLGGRCFITQTNTTYWRARGCPAGESNKSWITLKTARKQYLFTRDELQNFIDSKKLATKTVTNGPYSGKRMVARHQCALLRNSIGFTEEEAARRAGITVPRLQKLLKGAEWRQTANGIPLITVQTIIKRIQSRAGYSVKEAAAAIGMPVQWVIDRKNDGTIRINRARWDGRRTYISEPMLRRLKTAKTNPTRSCGLGPDWLRSSAASFEAGVSATTLVRWAKAGELKRQNEKNGWHYHREAVRARSRRYWKTARYHRAQPPQWLVDEMRTQTPTASQQQAA